MLWEHPDDVAVLKNKVLENAQVITNEFEKIKLYCRNGEKGFYVHRVGGLPVSLVNFSL